MGSSYTFLGPLIYIRSKGEKKKSWSCHYCSLKLVIKSLTLLIKNRKIKK